MYFVEPVDRAQLPVGNDWIFIEEPCGDVRLVVANDASPIEVPPDLLCDLVQKIVATAYPRAS